MTNRKRIAVSIVIGAAVTSVWAAGGGVAVSAQAQGPPPVRVQVTTTQVKPDMLLMWQDLIRNEAVPALKKTGLSWRWVFSTGAPVGQGFTYVTVSPLANYAQIDQGNALAKAMGPDVFARYNAKVRSTLVSTNTVLQTLIPDASIVSYSSTPPALQVVTTIQLLPGKGQEFAALTASEYVPAMKKAGVTDYLVFATNFGGSNAQRTIVTPLANFAALDSPNPLARALGAEAAQKLNLKRAALTSHAETTIVRFVPDLSYGAPTPPKR